jgi:4-diphosphocytidyl-2-C-methyl-D-erythritol kinase
MQAGLGGGSSDAAAAIRALGDLWHMSRPAQHRVAASLGADIPFFLEGGTALGVERGDVLFPLRDHPNAWVVVAVPGFGVSTKDAYRWFDRDRGRKRKSAAGNDLQGPVSKRHSEIGRLVRRLRRAGARSAAMSGSGSAVFGLFSSKGAADRAARALSGPKTSVIVTRTLSRAAYRRLAAH